MNPTCQGFFRSVVIEPQTTIQSGFFANIEHVNIQDGSSNSTLDRMMKIVKNDTVRTITIGNDCYKKVSKVTISSCPALTSLIIGKKCFTTSADQSHLQISKNSSLKECRIGDGSFEFFERVTISGILFNQE